MTSPFLLALIAASLAFNVFAWRRSLASGAVLAYAARRTVPWGALAGGALAWILLLLAFVASFAAGPTADNLPPPMTDTQFINANLASLQLLLLAGLLMLTLKVTTGARLVDFGLNAIPDCWRSDLKLGGLTALTLFGPVYVLYFGIALLLSRESEHPTLLQLANSGDPLVFAAAFLGAAIVAPLFEEFVFRSLLQGWLEKLEDQLLGWRRAPFPEGRFANQQPEHPSNSAEQAVEENLSIAEKDDASPTPPITPSIAGLPHGWAPLLISAMAFGLAHINAWPAPAPMFLFGVIQGYVYQRTHRLVPCIVSHMTFNSVSLMLTWFSATTS